MPTTRQKEKQLVGGGLAGFQQATTIEVMITLPPRNIAAMKRERRSKPDDANGGFDAWLHSAGDALERKHGITRAAIRQRMWNDLYIVRVTPEDAADRAAAHYRNRQTPKDKNCCGSCASYPAPLYHMPSAMPRRCR